MIPYKKLFPYLQQMLDEEWGYIWGTAGVLWTEEKQKAVENAMAQKYGAKWINHMVTDCSGVMVYIWKQFGLKIPHGSNSIKNQSVGKLQNLPAPGYAAFRVKDDDYYHIGIVGSDGQTVYESQGTITGFTTSPASRWAWFAPFKDVDYRRESNMVNAGDKAVVFTNGGRLNVRNEPSTKGDIITKLTKGTEVDVVSVYPKENFAYVKAGNVTGYVSMDYLEKVESEPVSEPGNQWAVILLFDTKDEAESVASAFKNAIVAEEGAD